jgi:hypothetical protein
MYKFTQHHELIEEIKHYNDRRKKNNLHSTIKIMTQDKWFKIEKQMSSDASSTSLFITIKKKKREIT